MTRLESTDVHNKYEDLSGVQAQPGENPYQALIAAGHDDPAEIQARYDAHRIARNAQQRDKFLSSAFEQVLVDPFLLRLEVPGIDPGFRDTRNCLVFWARPPEHVLRLAARVQERLKKAAPNIWLMPLHRMHMTALEICHSRTPEEAASLLQVMADARPPGSADGIAALVDYPYGHRARLVKPMVSYDLAAVALSFVPAAGEPHASPPPVEPADLFVQHQSDAFTYHHLRRDLYDRACATGVPVASRYVVPSAHITLARFLSQQDHATPAARRAWVDVLDEANAWLRQHVWPATWAAHDHLVGEWVVGQERGLDARTGPLWYGGGRSVRVGEGF